MANNKIRPIPHLSEADIQRFWSMIDKSGGRDACWPWTGKCFDVGYGRFYIKVNGKWTSLYANRIALFLTSGKDPAPLMACHSCDNRPCCNGTHLFPDTNEGNTADSTRKGRRASGDRNGSRTHPERLRRGARPECGSPGESNPAAVLTEADVAEIRRMYATGAYSQQSIADLFGRPQTLISRIVRREIWKQL